MNLLEITLAMVLFSTVVVFISSICTTHARIIGKSRSRMVATFLAEQLLEDCINRGYFDCENIETPGRFTMSSWMRGKQIDIDYEYDVSFSKVAGYLDRLKVVKVRVKFPGEDVEDSAYREVIYETMLARAQ